MTIAQQIGQRHESVENAMRLGQFGQLVKCLMLGGAGPVWQCGGGGKIAERLA
jgi:hypothetical protein